MKELIEFLKKLILEKQDINKAEDGLDRKIPTQQDFKQEDNTMTETQSNEEITKEELEVAQYEQFHDLIKAAMPNCDTTLWAPALWNAVNEYEIYGERMCMFLAQIGHESADLTRLTENLNYSVDALTKLFGNRITEAQAKKYGRSSEHKANQEAIANIIYGGSWGLDNLGNKEVGDGWKYRGRGAKQITGRYNYRQCGAALGVDLLEHPDLLTTSKHICIKSAAWFFNKHTKGTDIVEVTRQINGGMNGLPDRKKRYEAALRAYHGEV